MRALGPLQAGCTYDLDERRVSRKTLNAEWNLLSLKHCQDFIALIEHGLAPCKKVT
jgi:hypothetical protein